jgi:hypothetical protein
MIIRYFELEYTKNEEILQDLLNIISLLSKNEDISKELISLDIMQHIMYVLEREDIPSIFIIYCIKSISNFLYLDDNTVNVIL